MCVIVCVLMLQLFGCTYVNVCVLLHLIFVCMYVCMYVVSLLLCQGRTALPTKILNQIKSDLANLISCIKLCSLHAEVF